MNRREKVRYARQAAQRILVLQWGPMYEPETWLTVARARGCSVHPFYEPDGLRGEYAPGENGRGVIQYNTAYSRSTQAKILVHEIGHHLLMSEVSGDLFGNWVRCYYDDDPEDTRHQICRIVEEIVSRRMRLTTKYFAG